MDKERITIIIVAEGHDYQDRRRFEVDVPSRSEVSSLFDRFTEIINEEKNWDQ